MDRIIDINGLSFGKDEQGNDFRKQLSVVNIVLNGNQDEPYYPVNDEKTVRFILNIKNG